MAWQKYRDTVWDYSSEVRKAKAHVELNLASKVKSNKKGFYGYTSSKKKTRENVDLLLNGARNLVTGAWKHPKHSMPFLPRFLLVGFPFRKLSPCTHWESLGQWIFTFRWGGLSEGTLKPDGHTQVHGTWWDVSMRAHQAGWCHWDRTLDYLWKILVIRRVPEDGKEDNIIPNTKKGKEQDLGNCRLISSPQSLGRCGST